jgi:hypothetical protein
MTTRTFPVSGPINLICRLSSGSLVVRAEEGLTEARATLTPREPGSDVLARTTVEMSGSTLTVHGPKTRGGVFDLPVFGGRSRAVDALDVEVVVPAGSPLKASTMSATVTTYGRLGSVDIAAGSTTVELDDIDGDARVRSGAGAVHIATITGSAVVRAGSSDVRIGEGGGDLDVAFGTGSLEINTARGSVRMRTGAGTARIGAAQSDVDLTSGSGQLAIGLPAGQQARLDVVTGSGQLRTDMPVEQNRSGSGRAVTIRARTGSGDVLINRAAS